MPPVSVSKAQGWAIAGPWGFGEVLSLASCAIFSSLPWPRSPQVFVSRASCAYMENGCWSPGHSSVTPRPGGQASSLWLAGSCEGGCITGLSDSPGACWFWVRSSSQSKQIHSPLPLPKPWCAGLAHSPCDELAPSGAAFTLGLPDHHRKVPMPEQQVFSTHPSQVSLFADTPHCVLSILCEHLHLMFRVDRAGTFPSLLSFASSRWSWRLLGSRGSITMGSLLFKGAVSEPQMPANACCACYSCSQVVPALSQG